MNTYSENPTEEPIDQDSSSSPENTSKPTLKNFDGKLENIQEVLRLLPHRYPFLLVDKIVSYTPNEGIVALKNVTFNEQFFVGHFPKQPIMPGVLIIEALAQTACLFTIKERKMDPETLSIYFMGIDKARFKRPVVPGDTLYLIANKIRIYRGNIWTFQCEARVDEVKVADAVLTATYKESK